MSCQGRDIFLADFVVDLMEDGGRPQEAAVLLSALQKLAPFDKYAVSWRVLGVWRDSVPRRQAPACPRDVAMALATLGVLLQEPVFAAVAFGCFEGLFRISELLLLDGGDVFVGKTAITVVLRVTKRGLEQRVVISRPAAVAWLQQYFLRFPPKASKPAFAISYSRFMRLLRKLVAALNVPLPLTSHSFRRGGASTRLLEGEPLADICALGRWASLSSAHEYLRRGELCILQWQREQGQASWRRVEAFSAVFSKSWPLLTAFKELLEC